MLNCRIFIITPESLIVYYFPSLNLLNPYTIAGFYYKPPQNKDFDSRSRRSRALTRAVCYGIFDTHTQVCRWVKQGTNYVVRSNYIGRTNSNTALFIVRRDLWVKNLLIIVCYRRTTLGCLNPSFCNSSMTPAASSSVQKAPNKSLVLFLAALSGRL